MKTLLFSLTVITCIVVSQSALFPYLTWVNELEDVNAEAPLEHQEQAPGLTCASCSASSEQSCTASQTIRQCPPSSVCITQEAFDSNRSEAIFIRECVPELICDPFCDILNASRGGFIQSCNRVCCNTSNCNAGSVPTTEAPTPMTTVAPTTPLVCGGALMGSSGNFTSPNFPNNYPNNVTCVWTITPQQQTLLRIVFTNFSLEYCRDFVEIFVGGRLVRRLTGSGSFVRRGKRSLEDKRSYYYRCYFGDEDEQLYDNDNDKYDDNGAANRNDDDSVPDRYGDDGAADRYNDDGVADSYNHDDNDDDDDIDTYNDDVDYEDNDEQENGEYLGEANGWGWRRQRRPRRPRPRPRPRRRAVSIVGTGREVKIVFSSDGNGTSSGFSAQFSVRQYRPWRPWRPWRRIRPRYRYRFRYRRHRG